MEKTINVLNDMVRDQVIESYTIAGAFAAIFYVEPTLTEDLDVIVSFRNFDTTSGGLLTFGPISRYLAERGYSKWEKEGILVEGWPIQFLPVSDALSEEALEQAIEVELPFANGVKTRVLRIEHAMTISIQTGRAKDHSRLIQFIEKKGFDVVRFLDICARHGLTEKWLVFCSRFDVDPMTAVLK